MEDCAREILDREGTMVLSTVRADGWPQATTVSYANDGFLIYFIISRQSQKFENIGRDQRVAIVITCDGHDPKDIKGLSIAAEASEVRDPAQQARAIDLVLDRNPGLRALPRPDIARAAVMRAYCRILTILDYSRGFGHADTITVGSDGIVLMEPARPDDWGFKSASE